MFQHGSLHEVVDQEKELCGCPPAVPKGNEFPLAQSEGLAPTPAPAPAPAIPAEHPGSVTTIEPLVYNSTDHAPQAVAAPATAAAAAPAASDAGTVAATPKPAEKKKGGFFGGIRRFFRKIFGAE
jgi:hypothetical protein